MARIDCCAAAAAMVSRWARAVGRCVGRVRAPSAGGEVTATRMRRDDRPGQPGHHLDRPCRSWSRPTASNGRASPRAGVAGGSCAPGRVAPDCGTLAGYSAKASSACSRTIRTCLDDSFVSSGRCQADEHPPGAGCRSPAGPSRAIGPIGSPRLTWKHQDPWAAGTLARPGRPPHSPRWGQGASWRLPFPGAHSCEVGPMSRATSALRPVRELGGLNARAVSESHALESRLTPCE